MLNTIERLTVDQMAERYPNRWLGITNIKYKNDDGVTIQEADVLYTDKDDGELMLIQIESNGDILAWYTTDNDKPFCSVQTEFRCN